MILDRIENIGAYRRLGPNMAAAIDYIARTDFRALSPGRHDVYGDRVYVMVIRGTTRPLKDITWEAHRNYIDVQYVVEGAERMGWVNLRDVQATTQPYDAQKDAALYQAQGNLLQVKAGEFVIFSPEDVHAPSVAIDDRPADVLKAVVKVRANAASKPCGY